MNKLAEAHILRDAATAIRKTASVVQERDAALNLVRDIERASAVEKVASTMEARGLTGGKSPEQLRHDLEKRAEAGTLPALVEAISMVGPDLSFRIDNHDGHSAVSSAEQRFLNSLTQ